MINGRQSLVPNLSEFLIYIEHKYGPQAIPLVSSNEDMINLEKDFVTFGLYKSIHSLKTVDLFFDCSQKQGKETVQM